MSAVKGFCYCFSPKGFAFPANAGGRLASACSERLRLIGWSEAAGLNNGKTRQGERAGKEKGCSPPRGSGSNARSPSPKPWRLEAGSTLPTPLQWSLPDSHARSTQICGLKPGVGNWPREKEGTPPHRPSISGYLGTQVETVTKDELQF